MKAGESLWTEQQDGQLIKLWAEGKKASEIAKAMRVSKNAVVGRAHRLQKKKLIEARSNPVKGGVKRVTLPKTPEQFAAARLASLKEIARRRPGASVGTPAEAPIQPPSPPPPPPPAQVPPQRPPTPTRHRCLYPLWGDKGRGDPLYLKYCDAPTRAPEEGGGVYCTTHAEICFARLTAHRDRAVSGLMKVAAKEQVTVAAPEGDPQELGMEAA